MGKLRKNEKIIAVIISAIFNFITYKIVGFEFTVIMILTMIFIYMPTISEDN